MSKNKGNNNSLNVADLSGDLKSPIIFPDSHYGLESAVWDNAQRIADMLPVRVRVFGDLTEEEVANSIELAKGAELQQKCWTEYSSTISRYLKALFKVREKQAEVAENVAEHRVKIAELEKDLSSSLVEYESKYRQLVANSRSTIATKQDDLTISLDRITSQYTEAKSKKEQKITEDSKKDATPFSKQSTSLVDRFRKARESRFSGAYAGITSGVKA